MRDAEELLLLHSNVKIEEQGRQTEGSSNSKENEEKTKRKIHVSVGSNKERTGASFFFLPFRLVLVPAVTEV